MSTCRTYQTHPGLSTLFKSRQDHFQGPIEPQILPILRIRAHVGGHVLALSVMNGTLEIPGLAREIGLFRRVERGDRNSMINRVQLADNLTALENIGNESIPLIYIDPPFNTGKTRVRTHLSNVRAADGDRTGFGGRRYRTTEVGRTSYDDDFEYFLGFLEPRLREGHRVLAPHGSFYLHLDQREVHYVKILMDAIFGRSSFLNEIIWVYDYGGRARDRWPAKHDTILFYVKDPRSYVFNREDVDREPYMAPGLVTPEKVALGKLPTDAWWHTIVSPTGNEKTGYPTQKPMGVLKRIIRASSRPGDVVLDFFAGSGTTGAAAYELGRRFHMIDSNPAALAAMRARFAGFDDVEFSDAAQETEGPTSLRR